MEVGFTLGEGAGQLIVTIAREHLLYSLNPEKALRTIKDSLIGCETQTALDILIGKIILFTDKDGVSLNGVVYHPVIHKEYPLLDIEKWSAEKLLQIIDTATGWKESLTELRNCIIKNRGKFDFTVKYEYLIKYFYDGDAENLIEIDDDVISSIKYCIVGIKNFLEESFRVISVIEWLYKVYPDYIPDGFTILPEPVRNLSTELMELMTGDELVESFIRKNTIQMKMVDDFIKNERNIKETLGSGIKPVDITKGWSAGWLSPTGDYYALNGSISNMLHNQIADALLMAKIIPITENRKDIRENPDRWLEKNGWVKVHGNHILYDGYNRIRLNEKLIPLTAQQKEKLIEYGNSCFRGILQVGYMREPIPAARLGNVDDIMLAKYFSF